MCVALGQPPGAGVTGGAGAAAPGRGEAMPSALRWPLPCPHRHGGAHGRAKGYRRHSGLLRGVVGGNQEAEGTGQGQDATAGPIPAHRPQRRGSAGLDTREGDVRQLGLPLSGLPSVSRCLHTRRTAAHACTHRRQRWHSTGAPTQRQHLRQLGVWLPTVPVGPVRQGGPQC